MATTVGRLKQGDLSIAGIVQEITPPITTNLIATLNPSDNGLVATRYSVFGLRVLYVTYNDNSTGYTVTQWLRSNGAMLTQMPLATFQGGGIGDYWGSYDVILFDYYVWNSQFDMTNWLGYLESDAVSIIVIGNDTGTNYFVKSRSSGTGVVHDIVIDENSPIYGNTNTFAGIGSSDVQGGITALQNGAKPLYYRTDTGDIMGYYYEASNGCVLCFDQEGFTSVNEVMNRVILFAASRSQGSSDNFSEVTILKDENAFSMDKATTNLIQSKGADAFFDTSTGWTLVNDTNYTSAIEYNSGAIYGKGRVLRVTDNDGNTSTSEWGGIGCGSVTGLTSQSYTMSIRYKVSGWTTGSIAVWSHEVDSTAVNAERSSDYTLPSNTFDGEWHVYSVTRTQTSGYNQRWFTIGMDKTNLGATIFVDAIQFEAKSYPTAMTNRVKSNSVLQYDTGNMVGKTAWTVYFEYKHPDLSSYGSNMVFLSSYDGTAGTGNWFGLNASSNTISNFGGPASPPNQWNKAAIVYNGTTSTLYLNGVAQPTTFSGKFLFGTNKLSFSSMIGWNSTTYLASHAMRRIMIYDRALTADEIKKLSGSFSVSKDGNVKIGVKERTNMASSIKPVIFPLDFEAKDKDGIISAVTEVNTVYEDGAVWIGQPATNVILNTDWSNWTLSYLTSIIYDDRGPNGINSKVISFIDSDGNGNAYLYCYGDYAPQVPSTTYTISVWVKTEAPLTFRAYTADNTESASGMRQYTNSVTVTPEDGWKRVVFNPITTPANTTSASLSFTLDSIAAGKRVWMCAPQMEATAFASPFTIGTRAVTDLHLPYNTITLNQPFTIMGWWKPYTVGNGAFNGVLTFNTRNAQTSNKRILIMEDTTTSTQLRAWLPVDGTTEKYVYSGGNIQTGKWNFFAFRRTATDVSLFHGVAGGNGLKSGINVGAATGIDWLNTAVDSTWGWLVGDYSTGSTYTGNGYYQDYMFIQSALSDADIQTIYKTPIRAYKDNRLQVQGVIREGKVL